MTNVKLIVAGLLALPALLVQLVSSIVVFFLSVPSVMLLKFSTERINDNIDTQHAIITGGSSGIGLAMAQDCVARGFAKVTLLARDLKNLETAKALLEQHRDNTKMMTIISIHTVNVTDAEAMKRIACTIFPTSSSTKPNNKERILLFCCAGVSEVGKFTETASETFALVNQINYLGTVYTVQAFLPHMMACGGHITLTSSMAGQLGIFGYTCYSPTKFALRGFAESLHMELLHSPISLQIVYPPDTDTPGHHAERPNRPQETNIISETGGLFSAQQVGQRMVKEALNPNPKSRVYFGLEGWMVTTLTAGMSSESNLVDGLCQVSFMGLLRFVSFFYLNDFWHSIHQCRQRQTERTEYGSM